MGIIVILILMAVNVFFVMPYYTGSKLRKLKVEYEIFNQEQLKKIKLYQKEIKELEKENQILSKALLNEKKKAFRIELELQKAKEKQVKLKAQIKKMSDTEIIAQTKLYLDTNGIINTRKGVLWNSKAMRKNFFILSEHRYLKFTLKPSYERLIISQAKQINILEESNFIKEELIKKWQRIAELRLQDNKRLKELLSVCEKTKGSQNFLKDLIITSTSLCAALLIQKETGKTWLAFGTGIGFKLTFNLVWK